MSNTNSDAPSSDPVASDPAANPTFDDQDANFDNGATLVQPAFARGTSTGSESSTTSVPSPRLVVNENTVQPGTPEDDAVTDATERLGLSDPATNDAQKLIGLDSALLDPLLLPDEPKGSAAEARTFTTIELMCRASLSKTGKDLVEKVKSEQRLKTSISETETHVRQLKTEEVRMCEELDANRKKQADFNIDIEISKELLKNRELECKELADKYAVAKWLKKHQQPLARAEVSQARSFINLPTSNHKKRFKRRTRISSRKALKRLGWEKSAFIRTHFDGKMLVNPRNYDEEMFLAYVGLLSPEELSKARSESHAKTAASEGLPVILEEQDDDDEETVGAKRRIKGAIELLSKKQRR